ncbi:hypothetical protein ACMWLZ_03525 [Klebsiella pneumoniae]
MKPTVISQDTPWGEIPSLLLPAYGETWLMVAIVMLFVVTLGGLVGVVLFNASPRGLFPHALLYRLLNWVVNMGRSLPFLVLMAAIIPFTYWLTGTTIGIPAAVVPMIGAGGIGYLAVVYGYQRFDNHIMIATIVALIATIQLIQFLGDRLVNRLRHTQGNLV